MEENILNDVSDKGSKYETFRELLKFNNRIPTNTPIQIWVKNLIDISPKKIVSGQ